MKNKFFGTMRRCGAVILSAAMLLTSLPVTAAASTSTATTSETFTNPVIYSDVPDVDVIRVGDTYYMSSTTMHLSPGVPIMKSKDLVNWEIVNYVYDTLTTNDAMSLRNGESTYGKGSWASSLRYHNGNYYVSFASYTTGKTYVYKTQDIENGPWTHTELDGVYHDQGLFFDDDGSIYMLYGSGSVKAVELEEVEDGLQIKEGGLNKTIISDPWAGTELSGNSSFLYGEGTHIQKIDGKYYIFMISWPPVNASAGTEGMRTELCFRADSLTGNYERKIILSDEGAAQGGIVDTVDGDWYGMVFKDNGSVGRTPVLVPVTWEDGWPIMGEDGKVPSSMEIPVKGMDESSIVVSDEFYNNAERKIYTQEEAEEAAGITATEAYEERAQQQEEAIAQEAETATASEEIQELSGEGYELLKNGGFEEGLDSWTTNDGATINISTEEKYSGDSSLFVTGRTKTGSGPRQDITGQVVHGGVYQVTAKVKYTEGPDQKTFNICIYNGTSYVSSKSIEVIGSGTIKKGEWGTITGTYTLESDRDTTATAIFVETSYSANPSQTNDLMDFYVDDVSVQEISAPDGLTDNLLENGGFENTTEPWSGKGATLTLTSEDKTGGRSAVYVSGRTATGDGPQQDLAGKVEAGDTLEISVNLKYTTGPDSRYFYVTAQYGDGTFKNMIGGTLQKGQWGTLSGTYTVPDDMDLSSVKVFLETSWTQTQDKTNDLMDFYADDFLIKLKPKATASQGENNYNGSNLDLAWQWNHNPDNNNWSLTERPGYLRLTTGSISTSLMDARNTLTQRTYGPTCSGSISMDVSNMKNGDVAGLSAFQAKYGYVGVKMTGGSKYIVMATTDASGDDFVEREVTSIPLTQDTVYFRTDYDFTNQKDKADFYYSLDGSNWTKIGEQLSMTYSLKHFMGYRFGIFNYATRSTGGYVDVDYFHVEDQAADENTQVINAGLGDAQEVIGVENNQVEIPLTLDGEIKNGSKIEASLYIPQQFSVSDVTFNTGNVTGETSYTYKGGQLKLTVKGKEVSFTNEDGSNTLATVQLKVKETVSKDTKATVKTDYVRVTGQDLQVETGKASAQITLTYLDMGAIAKTPGNNNPLIDHKFGADPYAMVYDGRVYIYMTNDSQQYTYNNNGATDNGYGQITTINVISSADMVNWTDHGEIQVAGKNNEEGIAKWASCSWAPAAAHKTIDGQEKFFLYFADAAGGIGVLEADSPIGPFTDPIGQALISWGTQASEGVTWLFDPAVLVDDDGTGYLYYGGGVPNGQADNPKTARVIQLADDMIHTVGEAKVIDAPAIFEDSGIHKANGIYYYSYCSNFNSHSDGYPGQGNICYMTSDSPMGPFTYQGEVLQNMSKFFGVGGNNHHAMFEFNGKTYITYHAQTLGKAIGNTKGYRSTHINEVEYDSSGLIKNITADYAGVDQTQTLNPYTIIEAETYAWQKGIQMETCTEPGSVVDSVNLAVTDIQGGDWSALSEVEFGEYGAASFTVKAAGLAGGTLELHLDSILGTKIGSVEIPEGDGNSWEEITCQLTGAEGTHSVYMVYVGDSEEDLFKLDQIGFTANEIPEVTPEITPTPENPVSPDDQDKGTKPAKVTGLKATATTTSVKLTWKSVKGATAYEVYGKGATGSYTKIATVKKGTSYINKKKSMATAYNYKVRAVNKSGAGAYSKVTKIITKPAAVKIASLKKSGQLKFKKAAGATYYLVYKYNKKKKTYEIAYKIQGKKVYRYKAGKYKRIGTAKVKKQTYTAVLKNISKGKYTVKAVVEKKGYPKAIGSSKNAKTLS